MRAGWASGSANADADDERGGFARYCYVWSRLVGM